MPKGTNSEGSNSTRSRSKRAIPAHYTKVWGDNIPYVLHSTFRALSELSFFDSLIMYMCIIHDGDIVFGKC